MKKSPEHRGIMPFALFSSPFVDEDEQVMYLVSSDMISTDTYYYTVLRTAYQNGEKSARMFGCDMS